MIIDVVYANRSVANRNPHFDRPAVGVMYHPLYGPIISGDRYQSPFAENWEQRAKTFDGHRHLWEFVYLASGSARFKPETVVRCRVCHCPRCGHSDERFPCQLRRHHTDAHAL